MNNIKISTKYKANDVNVILGCIACDIAVEKSSNSLVSLLDEQAKKLSEQLGDNAEIYALPEIAATRAAYKTMGKDPARYRASSEALMRRILSGKGMYHINNVVEVNNLISISRDFSIGAYDTSKICGNITFRTGEVGETYKGIGRGDLNLENLPLFADENGAFGSPTSDSERTMITEDTKNLLMVLISFNKDTDMQNHLEFATSLLSEHCNATNIETKIAT
jgi:DNA/RNA-binding domain of Phe-tRNA-synthetase-like protein